MIIESAFTVDAPPDEVYHLMLDVEKVAPCIPGAHILGRREDGSYDAEVKVKLGPVSMTYRGTVAVEEHDDAERTAKLRAKANEARGQGTAQAVMSMAVAPVRRRRLERVRLDRPARQRTRRPDGPGDHAGRREAHDRRDGAQHGGDADDGDGPRGVGLRQGRLGRGAVASDRVRRLFGRGDDDGGGAS